MSQNEQKSIGFDLDDVLLECNVALRLFHNRCYGTAYDLEDVTSFELEKVWGCSKEEAKRRIFEFFESPEHSCAKPVVGAQEAVEQLKKDHTLHIITAKPDTIRDSTVEWLQLYYPDSFESVHFTNHLLDASRQRSKGEVCEELGIDIFIDDSLKNVEDVAGVGVETLLYDRPWNQEETNPAITRVFSWAEIIDRILNKNIVDHA